MQWKKSNNNLALSIRQHKKPDPRVLIVCQLCIFLWAFTWVIGLLSWKQILSGGELLTKSEQMSWMQKLSGGELLTESEQMSWKQKLSGGELLTESEQELKVENIRGRVADRKWTGELKAKYIFFYFWQECQLGCKQKNIHWVDDRNGHEWALNFRWVDKISVIESNQIKYTELVEEIVWWVDTINEWMNWKQKWSKELKTEVTEGAKWVELII